MKTNWLSFIAPPLAVYKKGSVAMCTGPIAVFWVTGIVSLLYGLEGGPLADGEISWPLLGLGALLWLIAAFWASLVIAGIEEDSRGSRDSTRNTQVDPDRYTADPMDELPK
jgi:hypothetical protein